jgi:hypothetical protein
MKRAWVSRCFAAAAGLAFGLVSAELSFGTLRPAPVATAPVLYSVEVRDDDGALLASPMLVGEEGQKLHLDFSRDFGPHSEPGLNMSLDLDPRSDGGENLCLGYKLSLDDGVAHQGRIGVSYGEPRSVRLGSSAGDSLHVEFVVARARTKAFDRILRARRRPAA